MRRRLWIGAVFGLFAGAITVGALVPAAHAKSSFESAYTLEQTYQTVLRLLRVDLGLKILERDRDAGYLLFEYQSRESGPRPVNGSIEMIDTGRAVAVIVQIPAMPLYHEQFLIKKLARKLHDEYGEPVRRGSHAPADGGVGGSSAVLPD